MPRIPTSGLNSAVVAAGMTPGTTYYLLSDSPETEIEAAEIIEVWR